MGKKLPPWRTKRVVVYKALYKLWMYSNERKAALKAEGCQCEECNTTDNIHVHHRDGTSLKAVVDLIYEILLVHPDKLEVLCRDCHGNRHQSGPSRGIS